MKFPSNPISFEFYLRYLGTNLITVNGTLQIYNMHTNFFCDTQEYISANIKARKKKNEESRIRIMCNNEISALLLKVSVLSARALT